MNEGLTIAFFSGAPGPGELILVFLVVLLLFGPRKLPSIARSIGQLLQQLRHASDDFKEQLMSVEDEVRTEVRDVVDAAMTPEDDLCKDDYEREPFLDDEIVAGDPTDEAEPEADLAQADRSTPEAPSEPDRDGEEEKTLGG